MKLSVRHPEVMPLLAAFPGGLIPLGSGKSGTSVLAVKIPKESILAARLRRGFKVYPIPFTINGTATLALVSAFQDDTDQPRIISTPLFDDPLSCGIVQCLTTERAHIHFFDEHDREFLAYVCRIVVPAQTRDRLRRATWLPLTAANAQAAHDQLGIAFGIRQPEAEDDAIVVEFREALMSEDEEIVDQRQESHAFHGAGSKSTWSLVREQPGPSQERDIALVLQRIFRPEHIYLNPFKVAPSEELCDVLVATDNLFFVIQAKDSPNTNQALETTIDRKRSKAVSSLKDGIRQVRRAAQYIGSQDPVEIVVGGRTVKLSRSRGFAGLIVVKELFNIDYDEYTPAVLDLADYINAPCIVLDYPELHAYTHYLKNEASFFNAFMRVYNHGMETGMFLRLRFGLTDDDNEPQA